MHDGPQTILEVNFSGIDERYSPPEKFLQVSLIGDDLFFMIRKRELENFTDTLDVTLEYIRISAKSFLAVFAALLIDQGKEIPHFA